jgi:hypothetical protein
MTFLPRPRKDAEEHQFVCNPQGLIWLLRRKGGEIAAVGAFSVVTPRSGFMIA